MTEPARPPRWHPRGLNNEWIVGATYAGVSRLPTWLTYRIGHVGTWLAYRLQRQGSRGLVDNFRGVFPEMPEPELRQLALRTYRSYARDTIDFMRNLEAPAEVMRRRVSRLETEAFDDALARGKGAIALSGHFGNWELAGVLLRRFTSYPLTVVAMREPDAEVSRLRYRLRAKLGIETIEVRQHVEAAIAIRRLLQQKRVVGMLLDRHVGKDFVQVTFFGRPAYFSRPPCWRSFRRPLIPSSSTATIRTSSSSSAARRSTPAPAIEMKHPRGNASVADVIAGRSGAHYWYQFYSSGRARRPCRATQDEAASSVARLADPVSHALFGRLIAGFDRRLSGPAVAPRPCSAPSPPTSISYSCRGWDVYLNATRRGRIARARRSSDCSLPASCVLSRSRRGLTAYGSLHGSAWSPATAVRPGERQRMQLFWPALDSIQSASSP